MQLMHIPLVHSHSPSSSLTPTTGALLRRCWLPVSVRTLIFLTAILYSSAHAFTSIENPPEPGASRWVLESEDVNCTEQRLLVGSLKLIGPQQIVEARDGVTIMSMTVNGRGTSLVEEGLQAGDCFSSKLIAGIW